MSADGSICLPLQGKTIRAADLFCGAGGTSTGAYRAARSLGAQLRLVAINHWPTAIATHAQMHPDARHLCADLEHVRPREAVPGGVLDLLMASPTCTYYSRARGGRPVNDQQRMDPWHVVRWSTELRVRRLLVENVPEMVEWGPCSIVTGRPIPSRKGEYFQAWLQALQAIGYRLDWKVLCCADYGDATTRERFFLMARSDGKRLRWPAPQYARLDRLQEADDIRLPWRGANIAIDWSDCGTSIFNRPVPLKPNTLRRILAGARRYRWPAPYLAAIDALLRGQRPQLEISAEDAAPILIQFRGTSESAIAGSARPLTDPLSAVTAQGNHHALIMATGSGGIARSVSQPIPTLAGNATPHFITPLVAPYYGSGSGLTAQSATDPLPAVTTKARFGLAEPIIVPLSNSSSSGIPRSALDPLRTITTAKGGDQALATPAIAGAGIDVRYRMLKWRELARASSFDDDGEYRFAGNTTEITKQIGNAVPVRTAAALVRALLET